MLEARKPIDTTRAALTPPPRRSRKRPLKKKKKRIKARKVGAREIRMLECPEGVLLIWGAQRARPKGLRSALRRRRKTAAVPESEHGIMKVF